MLRCTVVQHHWLSLFSRRTADGVTVVGSDLKVHKNENFLALIFNLVVGSGLKVHKKENFFGFDF